MSFLSRWQQRRKANAALGKMAKGGEQGASELHRKELIRSHIHEEGSSAWVLGKVHDEDLSATNYKAHFLSTNEECHCWIMGATRSDKGVSQLMYNILTYLGSQVIFDPKGDAYLVAAKCLAAKGKKVFLFDPLKKVAMRLGVDKAPFDTDFNPMLDMMGPHGLTDPDLPKRVTEFTNTIVELGKDGGDAGMKFWNLTTKEVVAGLLSYGLFWKDPEALRSYEQTIADGKKPTNQQAWDLIKKQNILIAADFPSLDRDAQITMLEDMASLRARIDAHAEEHGVEPIYPSVIDLIEKAARSALRLAVASNQDGWNSLLQFINTGFHWIDGPGIKDHLRGLDLAFGMSTLMQEDDVVVFVVIPSTSFESHGAYLRMVFTSMVDNCTTLDWGEGVNPKRRKINVICDEVPLWGYMPALKKLFNLGAETMRAVIISQNKADMDGVYGANTTESFIDNSFQILLSGGGNVTGDYFSKKAGNTWIRDKRSGERGDRMVKLYEVDELWNTLHRSRGTALLFENGAPPMLIRKVKYFDCAESDLKKFIDFTPHPDHASAHDRTLDPEVPTELLGHTKGNNNQGGRRHMQLGSKPKKRLQHVH